MRRFTPRDLTLAAVVAALYAVMGCFGGIFGLTFGPVQFRFAEALTVLPFLYPATAPGLAIGCLITNLLSPYGPVDVIFGTLATLLACLVTYKLRNFRVRGLALPAALPPVLFNALIVGPEIAIFFSDTPATLPLMVWNGVTVALGEVVACGVLGVALVKLIESNPAMRKLFTE